MTENSIEYLKNLLKKSKGRKKLWDVGFLHELLYSNSVVEIPGNPEVYLVSFAAGRATLRQESARKAGKRTIGLNNLIQALSRLDQDSKIKFYNLENREYRGTCFVQNDSIVGYEFVNRTGGISIPGLTLSN